MVRSAGTSVVGPRVLVALLTISIFINYIDRSNLSVAAPLLQQQLHYTTSQIGVLSSAFFWTYSLLQLIGVSGWVSDKFPVGWVFAVGFLIWSGSTLASGWVHSFTAFFVMRLLLGVGESLAYPCYSRLMAMEVPQAMRGRANALLDAGSKLGPALGTFLGGLLLARYSWRVFFITLGAAGLLWIPAWIRWMPRSDHQRTSAVAAASFGDLLRQRSAWGAFGGHFCGNYFWFFLLIWMPSYLVNERGFSMTGMAKAGSAAYGVIALATICAGWGSDALLRRGASVTRVRKSVVVAGLLGSMIILPVAFVQDTRVSIILLYAACIAFGTYTSNHWAITQTLAGASMAGRWTSVQNGVGNFSGIVAAWLTAAIVERSGSYRVAFIMAAVVVFVGAAMWGLVVGPVREVVWKGTGEPVRV